MLALLLSIFASAASLSPAERRWVGLIYKNESINPSGIESKLVVKSLQARNQNLPPPYWRLDQ